MFEMDEEKGVSCHWKLLVFESITLYELNGK
jgi:hypothetical protein